MWDPDDDNDGIPDVCWNVDNNFDGLNDYTRQNQAPYQIPGKDGDGDGNIDCENVMTHFAQLSMPNISTKA